MKKSLLASLVALVCLPTAALPQSQVADNSGNHWLGICTTKGKEALCAGYVVGLLDGTDATQIALGDVSPTNRPPKLFCLPAGFSNTQGRDLFVKYLQDYPAARHLPASLVFFAGLRKTFPCTGP